MQSRLGWLAPWVLVTASCNAKTDAGAPPPAVSQARAATDARGVTIRGLTSADRAAMPPAPAEVGMPVPPKGPGPKPAPTSAPPAPPATGAPAGGTTVEHIED